MYDREEIVAILGAIGDPVRLEILYLLGKKRPLNVNEIASQFRLSRPAISHHLKVLKNAHLLLWEKKGQEIYYILNRDQAVKTLRDLASYLADDSEKEEL